MILSPWPPLRRLRVNNPGVALYPPWATFGPRLLKDFELVWIIEGETTAVYDHHELMASPGAMLLCRKGMRDRYIWSRTTRTIHAFIHFDFEPPRRGWPKVDSWPFMRSLPPHDVLRPLFRYILGAKTLQEPLRSSLVVPCMELILRGFVSGRLATAMEPRTELPLPIELALKAISGNTFEEPPSPLPLSKLARAAHVTPEHLCRLFQRTLNFSPLETVRLARMERAATLMERTNLSIKQAADATGFANPFHFSRLFRKVHGVPPRAYRQAFREGRAPAARRISRALPIQIFPRM